MSVFFGVNSKTRPLSAKFNFEYAVPQIYKSTFYFKSLKLNEEEVTNELGSNDWNNSTPEAGIRVTCDGNLILYDYSKNSFEHNVSAKKVFYHLDKAANLYIRVLDVDYGFNGDDLISDTLISLKELEAETYKTLKLPMVEELKVYTKFNGPVNQ